jgi:hypothetical protein
MIQNDDSHVGGRTFSASICIVPTMDKNGPFGVIAPSKNTTLLLIFFRGKGGRAAVSDLSNKLGWCGTA